MNSERPSLTPTVLLLAPRQVLLFVQVRKINTERQSLEKKVTHHAVSLHMTRVRAVLLKD